MTGSIDPFVQLVRAAHEHAARRDRDVEGIVAHSLAPAGKVIELRAGPRRLLLVHPSLLDRIASTDPEHGDPAAIVGLPVLDRVPEDFADAMIATIGGPE
jgi:hypothetical protein